MSLSFRTLALAGTLAFVPWALASAADDVLPPEPTTGEWLEDRLDDGDLWFASSENLEFESVARELAEHAPGRRWVRVIDGKPAWVMYYVPGVILGFEVDTHHFGAAGTDFRFAAGQDWRSLTAVETDFEEIAAFDAKWMRLYRASDSLPAGACFLKIEFPQGAEVEAARLTEVWLRCRFDAAVRSAPAAQKTAGEKTVNSSSPSSSPAPAAEIEIEPYVVWALVYHPSLPGLPTPPPIMVDAPAPLAALEPPELLAPPPDLLAEFDRVAGVSAPAPSTSKPKTLLSRLVDLLRLRDTSGETPPPRAGRLHRGRTG